MNDEDPLMPAENDIDNEHRQMDENWMYTLYKLKCLSHKHNV